MTLFVPSSTLEKLLSFGNFRAGFSRYRNSPLSAFAPKEVRDGLKWCLEISYVVTYCTFIFFSRCCCGLPLSSHHVSVQAAFAGGSPPGGTSSGGSLVIIAKHPSRNKRRKIPEYIVYLISAASYDLSIRYILYNLNAMQTRHKATYT